ncbi:MAG: C-GCAxxG-C-C family protein [Defluviitaleaceae bacterium]|nr:C-GCAxxG-C-C family protein [Defluviitaleaceae bacterium]
MGQSRADKAVDMFDSGFNCAQAVVSAYCEELGVDMEAALRLACGFGAGMGRLQGTCGAVSGAYMIIGLKYGNSAVSAAEDKEAKEKTYAMVREFAGRFEERNKTAVCRELLGIGLISGDGRQAAERVNAVCPKMVRDAVEILEGILFAE